MRVKESGRPRPKSHLRGEGAPTPCNAQARNCVSSVMSHFLPMRRALLAAFLLVGNAHAELRHRWSFNQAAGAAPSGTVFTDTVGGMAMTVRGLGATLNGARVVLPGTTTSANPNATISAYLDLPNGIVSSKTSITVELWAAPIAVRNWQPLFEFGRMNIAGDGLGAPGEWTGNAAGGPVNSQGSDLLGCSLHQALNLNSQYQVVMTDGGFQSAITSALPTVLGTTYHYVIVVQGNGPTCTTAWYRNGALVGTGATPFALSAIEDVNNWLGRSQWSANSTSNAAYDEVRLYDHAMSAAEVSASFAAGQNIAAPVAQPDAATLHHGQKVRVAVLANDTGTITPASLVVVTPPASGTAMVGGGQILYTHTTGSPAADSFTYRVTGPGGNSAVTTVTLTFATTLRIPNATLNVPAAPPPTTFTLPNAFGALTFDQPIHIATAPGAAQRVFVVERRRGIRVIPNVAAPTSQMFLNLAALLATRGNESIGDTFDQGVMSVAFHPQHASNGHCYLFYSARVAGLDYFRISRFTTLAGNPNAADPASELVLIQQRDVNGFHLGTDLHFGPDGYLYIALGDGGGQNDSRQVSQRIDLDFFSAIARIDVDKLPGNPEPNLHASVPRDAGLARYSVPAGNPFVTAGATVLFNNVNLPAANVRTEFFAVGMRNPWRFSFDSATGELWCGDVGQVAYEEVNLVANGGNYGWSFREGTVAGPQMFRAPPGFVGINPLYQYGNPIPGAYNRSITGGFVYRGANLPSLTGAYIFADFMTGDISSLRRLGGGGVEVQRIAGEGGIVAFAADPSNGDVLLADIADGVIRRLTPGTDDSTFPQTLSATNLFADVTTLSPAPGLLPYTPHLSFWSDHAEKRRWFLVPDAVSTMTWQREGAWTYPTGMVWVKHFDLETTRGQAATARRIETRVLVKTATGSYGVSYRWNAAQTEATLVPDAGADIPIDVIENGAPRVQQYRIPSRAQCIACHTPQAGHALSFNTRQLNGAETIHGFAGNQLTLLQTAGYFSNAPDSPNLLPRHLRPGETTFPVEARVRSYLDVNCANCHHAGGTASGTWDVRAALTLAQTGLIRGAAVNNGGSTDNQLIVPGSLTHSIVFNRVAVMNGFTRMPPLGSNELDPSAIALLTEWIGIALPSRQSYAQWRLAHFGSAVSPEGAPAADADADGASNEHEFLAGTAPLNGASFLLPQIGTPPANIALSFTLPPNRAWQIETSLDLQTWSLWNTPGNAALPHPGGPATLTGPRIGDRQFFRLVMWEN